MISKGSKKKVLIIGAGIAGLAACSRLRENGLDANILEARDRCGGRIWTDYTLGVPFGRGAAWIHGVEGNPITQLAKKTHAKKVAVDPNKFVTFDRDGNSVPHEDIRQFTEKFELILKQAKEFSFCSEQDISLSSSISGFIKDNNFSPIELSILQSKLLSFESYIGANYESLSARYWDQEEAWPGENCFLISSYQPIIEELTKNCQVELNTIVKEINTRENDVEVVTENSIFYADAVIVTVPLGVLKRNDVVFNPALPNDKQKAIQRLEMGLFNITAMKFPVPFWSKESHAMFFTQFDHLSIPIFFNLHHFIQQPILVGYSGGERARQLENFTDSELIEKTMNNFKKVFGADIPDPESFLNTRWSHDPFSYGSYSYTPTGASGSDYETLAEPILNRVFFAGEATSARHPATIHGAYLSGIREAKRIIEVFGALESKFQRNNH